MMMNFIGDWKMMNKLKELAKSCLPFKFIRIKMEVNKNVV